ncbi:MAG TPA: sodium:solute symporter, partial [Pseudonocardiaceae bacterium]|nr:sodium:solute symporter [Pseudonocardiaceae bacterium]
YVEFIKPDATHAEQAQMSKLASLVVKFGALAFILLMNPRYAIDLQLIGGVLILQTLPAVAIALYTRWLHLWGLVAGWVVGMGWGVYLLYTIPAATGKGHFGGSALALGKLSLFGWHPFGTSTVQIYVGIVALIANLVVAVVGTLIARAVRASSGADETHGADYHADAAPEAELTPVNA